MLAVMSAIKPFEPRLRLARRSAVAAGSDVSLPDAAAQSAQARLNWMELCASRMTELWPEAELHAAAMSAAKLWGMVGHFHPEIAAEMEYEVWRAEN